MQVAAACDWDEHVGWRPWRKPPANDPSVRTTASYLYLYRRFVILLRQSRLHRTQLGLMYYTGYSNRLISYSNTKP